MINSSCAMEPLFTFSLSLDQNNPFVVQPSAPSQSQGCCESCFNWKALNNCIMGTLKKTEVIGESFEFKENQHLNDAMTLFNEAISEKNIARERKQIFELNGLLQDPKINLDKNIRDKIAKRVGTEVAKENPSVVQCVFDCMNDIQTMYNKPKPKPWTVSENVNNAFKLMRGDLKEMLSIAICAIFFPVLLRTYLRNFNL